MATCEMSQDCTQPVTHMGNKGYVYCKGHAVQRRQSGYERTRAMRPWEIRWVTAGKTLPSYTAGPEPKPDTKFWGLYA